MVHYDFGGCAYFIEYREGPQRLFALEERLKISVANGGLTENQIKARKKKIAELKDKCIALIKHRVNLNLDIGIEAMAYNYAGGKVLFVEYLKDKRKEFPISRKKSIELYDILRNKVRSNGKLPMLREVKRAVDQSYADNRDFFEVFL